MAVSKAQQRAGNKYMAANYDRVNLTLPKGQKDVVQGHAAARGESVNGFIGRAIAEAMGRDSADGPQDLPGRMCRSSSGVRWIRRRSETNPLCAWE